MPETPWDELAAVLLDNPVVKYPDCFQVRCPLCHQNLDTRDGVEACTMHTGLLVHSDCKARRLANIV